MWPCSVVYVFFFQAEDGIRDLVRSRGLGDVYKRQCQQHQLLAVEEVGERGRRLIKEADRCTHDAEIGAVSYTHLTLPTSDLV